MKTNPLKMVALAVFVLRNVVADAAITVDLVNVGNVGNGADWTGCGAVTYDYTIGKYDVTIRQYTVFLNAVAVTDT